jgi:hypothetical protein
VFFYLKLPHFELNRIGGIRGYWGRQGSQLEVPYSLRELSSVLGVGPTNIVDNLLGCLDVLVRASFAGRVIDKTLQRGLPPFKLGSPGSVGAGPAARTIVAAVASATAASAATPVVEVGSCGWPVLCCRAIPGRRCRTSFAFSRHLFVFYVESR